MDAARERARDAERSSGGKGSGSRYRLEALGAEERTLAKLSKSINDRIFSIERENDALALLATGQVRTREGAQMMADAMAISNGTLDAGTAAAIRQYEANVQLNEQLERAAQNPLRDYIESLPTAVEGTKQLGAALAQHLTDSLEKVFLGEGSALDFVDGIRRTLAKSLAQQTTRMILGPFAADDSGIKQGAQVGAPILSAGIISGATAGASILASAIAGASGVSIAGAMPAAGAGGGGGLGFLGAIGSIFGSFFGFAEGGYSDRPGMTSHAVPITAFRHAPHYAQGTANTSGIPAILHDNEAVVPLSKGRKIPVDASGLENSGGNYAPSISNSISIKVETSENITDPAGAAKAAKVMGDMVELKVNEVITRQLQYGGTLNPRGR